MAVTLLELLGFNVNREKSCLIPTQVITFLGFVIDSTVETLSLPEEKVVKVKSICKKAKCQTVSWAPLEHSSLQDLKWAVLHRPCKRQANDPPTQTLFITTNAYKTEWRVVSQGQLTKGRWSAVERAKHISVLELKATFLALKSFLRSNLTRLFAWA